MHNTPKTHVGRFKLHIKQFGFIEGTTIFVDKFNKLDAFDRDLVEYQVISDSLNRESAKILRVVERYKHNFVVEIVEIGETVVKGEFHNKKVGYPVTVLNHLKPFIGERVVVRLEAFDRNNLQGVFIKSLGHKYDAGADIATILNELELEVDFIPDSYKEEEKLVSKIEEFKKSGKFTDLTHLPFFTIDPSDSKDFDDSICVESIGDDKWAIYIAIADVWSYLKDCPNIERDALSRTASIYLLNSVIPMIPFKLSNDLCSLVENDERNTLVARIEVQGTKIFWNEAKLFPAIIKSKKRFTYDQVNDFFAGKDTLEGVSPEVITTLKAAFDIYKKIDTIRERDGYLQLNKDVYKFNLNEQNEIESVYVYMCGEAQKLIETYMVMANVCVACYFRKNNLPCLYRYHDRPKLEKIQTFVSDAKELNCYLGKLQFNDFTVKVLNTWIDTNQTNPHLNLFKLLMLQSLERAKYHTDLGYHFGLNLQNYLHFTSPIRRLPDLIVHKLLWMHVFEPEKYTKDQIALFHQSLKEIASRTNESEAKHSEAEFLVNREKIFRYLTKKNRTTFEAVVISKQKYGLTAKIDNIYDVFVKTDLKLKLSTHILVKLIPGSTEFYFLRKI